MSQIISKLTLINNFTEKIKFTPKYTGNIQLVIWNQSTVSLSYVIVPKVFTYNVKFMPVKN